MDKLLWLVDIDGTILNVHKNQVPAWTEALQSSYNVTPEENVLISYFGKPFKSVLWNVAKHYNVDDETIAKGYVNARKVYTTQVSDYLKKMGGNILPGAIEFLELLGARGHLKAIATGNPIEEGSFKLSYFDMLKYFDITVYAEERDERIEMVKEAVRQGKEEKNMVLDNPKKVVVIGDTKMDIESAKLIGGTSIGVTTGHTSKEELEKVGADYVLDGVKSIEPVLDELEKTLF